MHSFSKVNILLYRSDAADQLQHAAGYSSSKQKGSHGDVQAWHDWSGRSHAEKTCCACFMTPPDMQKAQACGTQGIGAM